MGEADCRIGSELEDTFIVVASMYKTFQIFKPQTTSLAVRELLVIFLLSLGSHALGGAITSQ